MREAVQTWGNLMRLQWKLLKLSHSTLQPGIDGRPVLCIDISLWCKALATQLLQPPVKDPSSAAVEGLWKAPAPSNEAIFTSVYPPDAVCLRQSMLALLVQVDRLLLSHASHQRLK